MFAEIKMIVQEKRVLFGSFRIIILMSEEFSRVRVQEKRIVLFVNRTYKVQGERGSRIVQRVL